MATSVRDLIKGSMRLIGVIASGETPSAAELADGLQSLNEMIASWSNESLHIYAKVREEFALTPAKQSYTLGPGGDFDSVRPVTIHEVTLSMQSTSQPIEMPVSIINQAQWASIRDKSTLSDVPTRMYAEGTFPLETANLWPIPSAANKLVLYSSKPLTEFASANDVVELPPGSLRALRYNLALELAPEYGKTPNALVLQAAGESKANLKRTNSKPHYLSTDDGIRATRFNIYLGE